MIHSSPAEDLWPFCSGHSLEIFNQGLTYKHFLWFLPTESRWDRPQKQKTEYFPDLSNWTDLLQTPRNKYLTISFYHVAPVAIYRTNVKGESCGGKRRSGHLGETTTREHGPGERGRPGEVHQVQDRADWHNAMFESFKRMPLLISITDITKCQGLRHLPGGLLLWTVWGFPVPGQPGYSDSGCFVLKIILKIVLN